MQGSKLNMDVKLFILLTFIQCKVIYPTPLSVSGVVSGDTTFLHKTFPLPSSMRAIIQVDVYDPVGTRRLTDDFPILGIYTTQDHVNVKMKCAFKRYGQFENGYLHPGIAMESYQSDPLNCDADNKALH